MEDVARVRNRWLLVGALLLLLVSVAACSGASAEGAEATPQGVDKGQRALDFTLETLDGEVQSLSDFEGSVVLVNFWATWCPPCRAEIPGFEEAYRVHGDEGFVVLGINVGEPGAVVEPFVADMDMTYPVLLDETTEVSRSYRAVGLPASLLVDRNGVIQARHVGFLSDAQLEDYLKRVLSRP
jgi:peroxiredoxin